MLVPRSAFAILPQTERDLETLEDQLRHELDQNLVNGTSASPAVGDNGAPNASMANRMPILLAPPQAHWTESKIDFGPKVTQLLTRVFGSAGTIPCAECRENRSYVDHDGRLQIHDGDIGLIELAQLKFNPAFKIAQSMISVEETPSGIALRWIRIEDGRILFSTLADSTVRLNEIKPRLLFAREADRRRNGESLSYVFFDLGIYPSALLQLSFLEQWGSLNQFITGITLSGIAPKGGLGGTFVYMLPWNRRQTAALTGFYLLSGLASSSGSNSDSNSSTSGAFVGQLKYDIAIGNSFGLFASVNTQGTFSLGLSFFNPILFPFLL